MNVRKEYKKCFTDKCQGKKEKEKAWPNNGHMEGKKRDMVRGFKN